MTESATLEATVTEHDPTDLYRAFHSEFEDRKPYSGQEVRDVIDRFFPAGKQKRKLTSPEEDVNFVGLASIEDGYDPRKFDEVYEDTQINRRREEILRTRIPNSHSQGRGTLTIRFLSGENVYFDHGTYMFTEYFLRREQ